MLIVLFQRISHGVCEPLAVGALLGIGFFLYLHWKKSRSETLLFAGLLLFMIGWRVALKIVSDRYALFLVPFAIFFSVWGIKLVADWGRRLLPRVPWALLWAAGLLITAVSISFLHHEEDQAFYVLLRRLRQDIQTINSSVILISDRNFSFFLDRRVRVIPCDLPNVQKKLQYSAIPVYVLFRVSRKAHIPAKLLREMRPVAVVQGRGSQKFSYYLWKWRSDSLWFLRQIPREEIDKYAAPEKGNLISNAGFEIVRPARETAVLTQRYIRLGANFYRKPGLMLPANWRPIFFFTLPNAAPPEFELVAECPVRGKYSLRMKIDPKLPREVQMPNHILPGDYVFSSLLRAPKDARFRLFFHAYKNGKYCGICNIVFCTIPADGTYYVSVPVSREELTGGDSFVPAIGGLDGEMFFDEVSLVPDTRAKDQRPQ